MAGVPGATPRNIHQTVNPSIVPDMASIATAATPNVNGTVQAPPMIAPVAPQPEPPPGPSDDELLALLQQPEAKASASHEPSDDEILAMLGGSSGGDGAPPQDIASAARQHFAQVDAQNAEAGQAGQDALRNSFMLGYQPQVVGAAHTLVGGDYTQSRDTEAARLKAEAEKYPVETMAGNIGGMAAGALIPGASLVGAGKGIAGAARAGAIASGAYGALANPGDIPGEITPIQAAERLKNGTLGLILGAATGGAFKAVTNALAKGMSKVPDAILKSVGISPTQLEVIPVDNAVLGELAQAEVVNQAAERAGVKVRPDELFPNMPDYQAAQKAALSSPEYQKSQIERGGFIKNAIQNIWDRFNPGKETPQTALTNISTAEQVAGQGIGSIRETVNREAARIPKRVLAKDPNANKIPMTTLQDTLRDLKDQWGFTPVEGIPGVESFFKPDLGKVKQLADKHNIPMKDAMLLIDKISKYSDILNNNQGHMAPAEANEFYNFFRDFLDGRAPAAGEKAKQSWLSGLKIKDALRDDYLEGAKKFIPQDQVAAYEGFMQRYAQIKQAPKRVQALLEPGSVAHDDILAWFDKGGLKNLDDTKQFMTIVQGTSPESAEALALGYGKRLFDKFPAKSGAEGQRIGGHDFVGLSNHLDKGANFERLQAIVGEERAQAIKDLATAGRAIQEADKPFQQTMGMAKYAKALVSLVKHGDFEQARMIYSADAATKKLMSESFEDVLMKLTTKERNIFSDIHNAGLAGRISGEAMRGR